MYRYCNLFIQLIKINITFCMQNYDREEQAGTPTHVVNWINGVIGTANDPEFTPIVRIISLKLFINKI